jgi:hypothetical protein
MYTCVHVHMWSSTTVGYMYVCMYTCIHVHMITYACIYVYICVSIYIYVCVWVCVCVIVSSHPQALSFENKIICIRIHAYIYCVCMHLKFGRHDIICMLVLLRTCICDVCWVTNACMYICLYVCMNILVYYCLYVFMNCITGANRYASTM